MKRLITKGIALLLVVFMVLSASACGKKAETKTDASTATTSNPSTLGKVKLPIVDKTETLTILATGDTRMTLGNDVPVFKELEKRTNVHLEWELLPTTGTAEKFNLVMVSGKLPDLVSYGSLTLAYKYAMQGAFLPLEDQIKKYAPNLQNLVNNPPYKALKNFRAELTAGDGHIYNVPIMSDNYVGELFFMREDWLKNINMKAPATTDELYTVLKAFKEKDPNGNKQADEIPYSGEHNLSDVRALGPLFGAFKGFYVAKDNTIKYSPVADKDRQLEAIKYMNKLYSEGLIDQEIMSQKKDQYQAKAAGDKVGMMYAWSISGANGPDAALRKIDPNKGYVSILPPKGPHGDQYKEDPQPMVTSRMYVTKDNKKIETTMKWIDYLFTEEGRMLVSWGIEGTHYKMVNGKPEKISLPENDPNYQRVFTLVTPGVTYYEEMKSSFTPLVNNAFDLYAKSNVIMDNFPSLPLNEEEQASKAKIISELDTYISENLSKLITGVDPITKYDSYVEGFSKIGVDSILKIYNTSYKKYLEFQNKK